MDTPTTTSAPDTTAPAQQRLMSVDALRGFDMFWIICAEAIVPPLHQISKAKPVAFVADQLEHVEWEGVHFEDLIFPLFVFIMGVSTVFSVSKLLQKDGVLGAMRRIVPRSILMFVMALIYSGGFSKHWPDIRLMGVLNRIALCYLFGATLFCFLKPKALAATAAALLLGYWAMMACIPFPDVRPTPGGTNVITAELYTNVSQLNMQSTNMLKGSYIQGVNLANYLDQKYLPGKKWDGTYDPEGFLSTIPAVGTCLLGILAGCLLKRTDLNSTRKIVLLLGWGAAGVVIGFLWGTQFPVIKKIWTSSYVLVAGGYSSILLGLFYLIVDVWKFRFWCQPFVWMGMNSITIYLTSNFLGGGGFNRLAERLTGGNVKSYLNAHVTAGFGNLVVALTGMVLTFWFLNFLYRKKIFLRL